MLFMLSLALVLKQQFNKLISRKGQTNRKQKSDFLFYNNIILKSFDSYLLKIDKKSDKDTDIYYVGYIAIKKLVIAKIFTV